MLLLSKKYIFKTFSPLTFNPTKAKIDILIEKYKIKKYPKNKMVAWNVIFTEKDHFLNCLSYTLSYLHILDVILHSLKLMGFCHWLHWEQEQAPHRWYLPLWKVMAVEREECDKTCKTEELASLLQRPVVSLSLFHTSETPHPSLEFFLTLSA